MAHKKKYRRSIEAIMQSDYVRLVDEAPVKYPLSYQSLNRKAREGRIRTYGSPESIYCPEFEEQMRAGFPIIEETGTTLKKPASLPNRTANHD